MLFSRFTLRVLLALLPTLAAAAPLRIATLNVELGLGAPGTAGHEAVADILGRLDADVVALQEVQSGDLDGAPSSLASLASALDYPVVHLPGTERVFDSSSRSVFLSRYPIATFTNIVPPPGAMDMARQIPAITVDVPGIADDPTILTLHLKCCFDFDDSFRRAVELHRAASWLEGSGFTAADNVIVLGDFNLIGFDQVYDGLPSGLPGSYVLGADVAFPVTYRVAPAPYFAALSMTALDARQLDGDADTVGSSTLDYILATPALTNRPHQSEIYNSALDDSNAAGLPKAGQPLPAGTSRDASDHLAVFADFELENLPPLGLSLSTTAIAESDAPGAAVLTVTLPVAPAPGETVDVTLSSSDPGEAVPAQTVVPFGPGIISREIDIASQPDALRDGDQSVTFTASAPGLSPAIIELTVTDTSPSTFTFSAAERTITESFATFDGSDDPARWPTSGGIWRGLDDGSRAVPGYYSYGSSSDPSLGALLDAAPVSTVATFINDTGIPITNLDIAYDAEQWRSSPGGTPDRISAELVFDGVATPLPDLEFTASTSRPSGAIPGGVSTRLRATVSALSISAGESFQLRFTMIPGGPGGGTVPADVFLNEIHYDNSGGDVEEFVEVVVGPGYSGEISDLSVVLYNGSGGSTYSTQNLDSFTLGETTASGHRIFSKAIAGIQNGSPDGLAIVQGATVLHFLSYEGTMTATNGPAGGMTSTDIGVSQENPVPAPGSGSLGLTGSGGESSEFSWARFASPYTPGVANAGQTFTAPAGSQGIAIDNVTVTALNDQLDTDDDGTPDLDDLDDDNDGLSDDIEILLGTNPLLVDSDGNGTPDGDEDADRDRQSNLAEVTVTLTNPLDPNSRFTLDVAPDPGDPSRLLLTFPTLAERTYTIERSADLIAWSFLASFPGDDTSAMISVAREPLDAPAYFHVRVTLP